MNNSKINNKRYYILILVVCIILFILSFFLYLYVIPICIIVIIICIFFRRKSKINYLFIVLFLIIIIFSIVLELFFKPKQYNDLVGTWTCSYYDSKNIDINIKINNEDQLLWNKYGDELNNYILGKYKLEKLNKEDENTSVKYYKLIITSDEYINNGNKQKKDYKKTYEIAINNYEEKAIFISNDNTILKCNKNSKENPIIE